MSTTATLSATSRNGKRGKTTAASAGQPDPRPLTDYDVVYSEPGAKSRITINLKQPCVIRTPAWTFIDCATGGAISAASVTVLSNQAIQFDFASIIATSVAFVNVPYQDTQVQNFQGGFVRPGAQWFRAPK